MITRLCDICLATLHKNSQGIAVYHGGVAFMPLFRLSGGGEDLYRMADICPKCAIMLLGKAIIAYEEREERRAED